MACYIVNATITAKTPLHIGSGKRTGVIKHTHHFIPGSFLRGAFGLCLVKTTCEFKEGETHVHSEDCFYSKLFGEEFGKKSNMFFRYAYPLHLKCNGVFVPISRTLYRCRNPQCHKIYNTYIPPLECQICDNSVKPLLGYYECLRCGEINSESVQTSRFSLTALDRGSYSAAQIRSGEELAGTLRTIEVIEAGSKFRLEIVVDADCKEYLNQIIALLTRGVPDEDIGGSKSRGLGKISIEDVKIKEISRDIIEARAQTINTKGFDIRLLSPMVLGNSSILEPATLLEAARRAYSWILHQGKPSLPSIKLIHRQFLTETFSGWSLKENRRRRVEPAFSTGSCFHFESESSDQTLAIALAALEFYSIGSYKPHGCGQVTLTQIL